MKGEIICQIFLFSQTIHVQPGGGFKWNAFHWQGPDGQRGQLGPDGEDGTEGPPGPVVSSNPEAHFSYLGPFFIPRAILHT